MLTKHSIYRLVAFLWLAVHLSQIAFANTTNQNPPYRIHTVEEKETVYSIARRNHISEEEIYRLNPGTEMGIRIGQQLKIPIKTEPQQQAQTPPNNNGFHVVQSGETLYSIAKRYGITVAILLQYNPDVTPEHLRPGMELRVAQGDGSNLSTESNKIIVVSSEGVNRVNISLLLPVGNKGRSKYIQFYEGFLLGLYQLKRNDISVNLDVYQTNNEQDIKELIDQGKLRASNLVIGGHTEGTVNILASYSAKEGTPYVSPFIAQSQPYVSSPSIFRLNTVQQDLYPYLTWAFKTEYGNKKILFIEGEKSNHKAAVAALKERLKNTGCNFTSCSYKDMSNSFFVSQIASNTVIVPDDSSKEVLHTLLTALEQGAKNTPKIYLFGYPEWQSYGKNILSRLGKFHGTIYSSFFFDHTIKESASFAKNYTLWFNHKMHDGFPKYDVLGYDVARYFVRAIASYGASFTNSLAQIPSDGLQMDFILKRKQGDEHFTSVGLYFITFDTTGKPKRQRVVY